MPILEKARASVPEPTKGPSKSAAAKPAAAKAQVDSSSASGGSAATAASSSGGNANKRAKPGSKPAESKASGTLSLLPSLSDSLGQSHLDSLSDLRRRLFGVKSPKLLNVRTLKKCFREFAQILLEMRTCSVKDWF